MTNARADYLTTIELLADMLELKLDGEVDFADDFEPWTFLRETFPPLADRMEKEALQGVFDEFLVRDPNNASKMRDYFDR